jgi:peptidoglycan/LPS O-acetylase OafA/YrhL
VLAILFCVTNHRVAALTFDENRVRWPFFAFYIQNIFYKNATLLGPAALGITWSLAVEEQFYTTWPFIVRNLTNAALKPLLFLLIALAPIARYICPQFGFDPYINPLCRFDAMAMGGLVAIWITEQQPSREKTVRAAWLLVTVFGALAGMSYLTHTNKLLSKTVENGLWTALLMGALASLFIMRVLGHPALRFLGKISYCAYLTHFIIASLVVSVWPGATLGTRALRVVVVLSMTCLIGMLSWRFLEEPLLRFKKYFSIGEARTDKRSEPSQTISLASPKKTEGTA